MKILTIKYTVDTMSSGAGYWEPHTSSVDFCEPNYYLTNFIAEPHNVWSSLYLTLLGLIGLCYANPLGEWRVIAQYGALAVVGLGSAMLHSTLGAMWQSADEVPMLWQVKRLLKSHSYLNSI